MRAPLPSPPPDSSAPIAPWVRASACLAAAAAVLIVLVAAGWDPLLRLDREVAVRLHAQALAHPAWTEANRVLTDWVWDPLTMRLLIAAAALWLWLRRKEPVPALWCVATSAVGTGVQQGLKAALGRDRPHWEHPVDEAHFAAMPSGHAMTAALTCTLLVWLVRRSSAGAALRGAAYALAAVSVAGVCLTRIALGVHWLTDTLVGSMLGVALAAASVAAWYALVQRYTWKPRGHNDPAPASDDAAS